MSRFPLRLSVHTTMEPAMSGPAWPPYRSQTTNGFGAEAAAAAGSAAVSSAISSVSAGTMRGA